MISAGSYFNIHTEQDTVFSLTKVVRSDRKEGEEEEATCVLYQIL